MDKRVTQYIDQIIGDFKIISYSSEKHQYLCKCQFCSEEKYLPKGRFQYEGSIRCKCTKSGIKKGDVFYWLTAKERDMSRINQGRVYWLWECKCGNIISCAPKDVKSGNTKSCGCLNNQRRIERLNQNLEDLTNLTFGNLTVLRLAKDNECSQRPKGNRYWYCQCSCGNFHIVSTSDLKSNKVQSCGCLISMGEMIISKILLENNIPFQKQYTFNDLKSENGRYYRFDFAIFNNTGLRNLIEFDGIQHYNPKAQFNKDQNAFDIIQQRDNIKNEYCLKNNIPLIRIPYYKISEIKLEDLIV